MAGDGCQFKPSEKAPGIRLPSPDPFTAAEAIDARQSVQPAQEAVPGVRVVRVEGRSSTPPAPVRDLRGAGERSATPPLLRTFADQVFSRVAGAALVEGNELRLLRDARENYPAWLESIHAARERIHFENYIIYDDIVGRQFAEALVEKAREGVRVRLLYDWLGGLGKAPRDFWRRLREGGVEVRCVGPPRLGRPLAWLSRDHRKLITVDGDVGFVGGLCAGQEWVGDPERGVEPWRDTGIEIRGPAVADLDAAFGLVWAAMGTEIPAGELPRREELRAVGEVALRVIDSEPASAALYRLDLLIAAAARRTLWLTDAYFVGTTVYVQALRAAAQDAVDVRLLVPGSSDLPLVRMLSRSVYRPLLEAGVRVFEWKGSMLHAKTAVADGQWARIGSSNLNLASWIGNWELDVAIEDAAFARQVEEMYEEDLQNAVEIVLERRHVHTIVPVVHRGPKSARGERIKRAAAGAAGIGSTVGAALTERRSLGPAEARVLFGAGLLLALVSALALLFPRVLALPLALLGGWIAVTLLSRAYALWRRPRTGKAESE